MKLPILVTLIACSTMGRDPLAKRIVHTDPSSYRAYPRAHGGAGELKIQVLLGRGALADLNFVHRGVLMPKSSIGHHFHNNSEEMFFILNGEAQFTVDGRTSALRGPVAVPCRAGHAHALYNASEEPLEWMNVNVAVGLSGGPGVRDPSATFDLGDDRIGVPLDPKPVFISLPLDKSLLRPSSRMNGGAGAVRYRRVMGPSLLTSKWAYMDHLVVPPGASVGRHVHPGVDEFYYAIAGAGTVKTGEESATLAKWDGVAVPMNEIHSLENSGSEDLELLVIGIALDKGALDTKDVK
jgi:mannose-6-phosphate isomerase-like protein (cupin superfamily)